MYLLITKKIYFYFKNGKILIYSIFQQFKGSFNNIKEAFIQRKNKDHNKNNKIIKTSIPDLQQMNTSKKHINFALLQQAFQYSQNPIQTIIKNVKAFSAENDNLLQKYNEDFFLTYFDKNTIKQGLGKIVKQQNQKNQLKMHQFIRTFLSIIQHKEQQTLFLAMSLRNLFLKIKQQTTNENGVKFSDFTNYLCERISKQNPDLIVPLKQIAQQKNTPDVNRIREIDINAPIVLKTESGNMPKIAKQKKKKDKKLCEKKPVAKFIYNSQKKQIITMGRLSSSIYFYDLELNKLPLQIVPKTYKDMTRQIAILSMAFNESHQRIGAIINGIGIAFWEASDNYQTQKTISKYVGDKIFYLELFKQWVTVDKNTLYFWDLKEQVVTKTICQEDSIIINDICEINHLRCICVSFTTKDDKKLFVVYKDFKPIVRYDLGSSGCHTLHYNLATQMVVTAGYHNQLQVFEVQNKTYSINLKKQLKGHSSIVTCVNDIKGTNFILSGDDSGQVRIWQLNFMRCIQVVKLSKYINQLMCTGQKLIFSDSRLNTIQMDKFKASNSQDSQIIYNFYEQQTMNQYLVTRKSIREINFNNGRILRVMILCDDQQQISSAIRISSGILIGTSKGIMKLYSIQGKLKWQIAAHQNQITQLKYDRRTRFIFSLGNDNKLMIWPQKSVITDGVKKMLTFKNKNYNHLTLFTQIRLFFLGSCQQSEISVWDYENLKLISVIKLPSPIMFMEVNILYRLLMISSINDQFYFIKLVWKNSHLTFQIIYNGDSSFSGLRKYKKETILIQNKVATLNKNSIQNQQVPNNTKYNSKDQNALKSQNNLKQLKSNNALSKKGINIQQINKQKQTKNQGAQFFVTSTKLDRNIAQNKQNKNKFNTKNSFKNIQFKQTFDQPSNIPSIKLIKNQSNKSQTQFRYEDLQQTIGTLKTLKNLQNQITTKIQIKQTQNNTILVVGNSKGNVYTYDINLLIKQHFSDSEVPLKKNESPHMYRPSKQDYDSQYSKHKHFQESILNLSKIQKVKKGYFKPIWKVNIITKQPILYISFIEMKQTYVCVSMSDGYCKYFDLVNGQIKGNLKVNLPLPIIWDIKIQKDLYIKKNVYETLLILDDILTNHGFQMLSKQYKAINISKFLQILKKKKLKSNKVSSKKKIQISDSNPQKAKNKITLLHQQYTLEDLKHVSQNQNTLKSLEAYKRVKQIKQKMNVQIKQRNSIQEKSNDGEVVKISVEVLRQKQQLQRLFASNYFPRLAEHGVSSKLNKSVEIGSLQQRSIMLLQKINKKKTLHSQYSINKTKTIDHIKQPIKLKRQASYLPSLPTLRSNYNESALMQSSKIQDKTESNKQNSLTNKIMSSFSNINKLNNSQALSIYSSTCPTTEILKSSDMNLKGNTFKESNTKRTKNESFKSNKYGVEDKPMKQILTMINQKLQKYKKVSYAKRNIF